MPVVVFLPAGFLVVADFLAAGFLVAFFALGFLTTLGWLSAVGKGHAAGLSEFFDLLELTSSSPPPNNQLISFLIIVDLHITLYAII